MTIAQQYSTPRNATPPPSTSAKVSAVVARPEVFDANAPWLPVQRMIDVGHSKLAYRSVGRGPDLLFVHGWPLHAATFRKLLPRLSQHFTCHLLDLPGSGDSEWGRDSLLGMSEHADSLRSAIEQLGLSGYALVGHDSGGLIARLIAQDNPAVTALALSNTEITGHHAWQVKLYALTTRFGGGGSFAKLMGMRWFRRSALAYGGCFDDLTLIDGDFHDIFVAPLLAEPRTLQGQLLQLKGFDAGLMDGLAQVHRRLAAPVLFIWGEDDPFFPLKYARKMLHEFPAGAKMVPLRPGKLFVHEEQPDAFVDAALPFLRRAFGS